MVDNLSKKAYKDLKDLGDKQRKVFDALGDLGVASNQDIADYLGWPINCVTGRMKELRDYKFVGSDGTKTSRIGTTVRVWHCLDPNDKKLHAAVGWLHDE